LIFKIKICNIYMSHPEVFAKSRGGSVVIRRSYHGLTTTYTWTCKEGHTWVEEWYRVVNGYYWCPQCTSACPKCKEQRPQTSFMKYTDATGNKCMKTCQICRDKVEATRNQNKEKNAKKREEKRIASLKSNCHNKFPDLGQDVVLIVLSRANIALPTHTNSFAKFRLVCKKFESYITDYGQDRIGLGDTVGRYESILFAITDKVKLKPSRDEAKFLIPSSLGKFIRSRRECYRSDYVREMVRLYGSCENRDKFKAHIKEHRCSDLVEVNSQRKFGGYSGFDEMLQEYFLAKLMRGYLSVDIPLPPLDTFTF